MISRSCSSPYLSANLHYVCPQLLHQQTPQKNQQQSLQIQVHQVLNVNSSNWTKHVSWCLSNVTLFHVNHSTWHSLAGTGSKSTPTTGDGSSSGNSIKLSIPLLLVLAATYASTFRTYWFFNQWDSQLKCLFFPLVICLMYSFV